jgi:HAD superfamily hydrolase (TIGR01509 family)
MSVGPVIFLDIGSTLVQADSSGPASRIASRLGLSGDQRRALGHAVMTTDFGTAEEVCAFVESRFGVEAETARRVSGDVWSDQEQDAHPVPGALEAMTRLQAEGWRLGLVSNIWQPYFQSACRHFGEFFDRHIPSALRLLSYQFGYAKPSPEIFAAALGRAGVPATEAVMVGDSYFDDIQPAAALGMATVWVLSRPPREAVALAQVSDGVAIGPTQTVSSLDALDSRLLSCAP